MGQKVTLKWRITYEAHSADRRIGFSWFGSGNLTREAEFSHGHDQQGRLVRSLASNALRAGWMRRGNYPSQLHLEYCRSRNRHIEITLGRLRGCHHDWQHLHDHFDRGQWQWNRRPHLRRGLRVYLHDSGIAGSLDVQPGGYNRSQQLSAGCCGASVVHFQRGEKEGEPRGSPIFVDQ